MNIQIYYNRTPITDFSELVKKYPDDEFEKETRSTIPHLLWWLNPEERAKEVLKAAGIQDQNALDLRFEYCVSPKGRGAPSHTDLMIIGEEVALGIEAKWTEPEYDTVAKWKSKGKKENREKVFDGWIGMIIGDNTANLEIDKLKDLPYQMIHRLASIASLKKKRGIMIYEVFNVNQIKKKYYLDNLKKLSYLLKDINHISIMAIFVPFIPSFQSFLLNVISGKVNDEIMNCFKNKEIEII